MCQPMSNANLELDNNNLINKQHIPNAESITGSLLFSERLFQLLMNNDSYTAMNNPPQYEQLEITDGTPSQEDLLDLQSDHSRANIINSSPSNGQKKRCTKRVKMISLITLILFCLLITILTVLLLVYTDRAFGSSTDNSSTKPCKDSCCVFCYGDMLDVVQEFDFFNDSKVNN